MPPYHFARLSDDQMMKIEALENEIGVTLVAYEPEFDEGRSAAAARLSVLESSDGPTAEMLIGTDRDYDSPH